MPLFVWRGFGVGAGVGLSNTRNDSDRSFDERGILPMLIGTDAKQTNTQYDADWHRKRGERGEEAVPTTFD